MSTKKGKKPYTVSETALAARRKGSAIVQQQQYGLDQPPGENSRITALIMECQRISAHADRREMNTLYECLYEYLQLCNDHDIRVTNLAAYMACGVDRMTISHWDSTGNEAQKKFARTVRNICSMAREQYGVDGKINPVVLVWHQKNYDNFSDNPTIQIDEHNGLGDKMSAAEIAEKYSNLPDD